MNCTNQFGIHELKSLYRTNKNYKIIHGKVDTKKCFIYFSGNGIYYPNNKNEVVNSLIRCDRYEWEQNIVPFAELNIFVRDIYKQWYVEGINIQIDSVDKLVQLLKKETNGYEIVCVGNSAGGYIATLIGVLLNASKVFSFGGQFSLSVYLKDDKFKKSNQLIVNNETNPEKAKYYDLNKYINSSNIKIYYFLAANNEDDNMQMQLVKNCQNVRIIAFNGKVHGITCFQINFLPLFSMSDESLEHLSDQCKSKVLSPYIFSYKVCGFSKTIHHIFSRAVKKILRNI